VKNTLKEKLARGENPVGTFFELGGMSVVEALGRTGLDFIIIDGEHGPFGAESAMDFVRAAEIAGLTPLARVQETSRSSILKLLDVGAQGLIVPDVHSAEQVRELVDYAKFSPLGKRGFCPSRKDGWGFDYPATEGLETNMAYCNAETLLIPQCETVGCLESIEEIAAMDGVDGIFIGPFDLSIAMGMPGRFQHPVFIKALERIRDACHAAGKFCIHFTIDPDLVSAGFAFGFDAMTYGLDAMVLIRAFKDVVSRIRNGASASGADGVTPPPRS
jgi:2-keto-3-deoxy-L-rhamnonate aldolase RhmA